MDHVPETNEKRMRLRYAGACRERGVDLPATTEAIYERSTKTVRCVTHGEESDATADRDVAPGTPGGSARREFERRKAARGDRIRAKHPKISGLILALSDEPQSTTAWDTGATGEERLGAGLNARASDSLLLLHDRRLPRSRANIDHLAVASSGVYVIDAKKYKGRPRLRVEGGLLRPRMERLLVGSRDCTKLVDGVLKQVDAVRTIVGDDVPVHGMLCFVEADWPLFGGSFAARGVEVLWPKRLYARLERPGQVGSESLGGLHRALGAALPPA